MQRASMTSEIEPEAAVLHAAGASLPVGGNSVPFAYAVDELLATARLM